MRIVHIQTKSGAFAEIIVPDEPILRRTDDELTFEQRLAAVQRYIQNRFVGPGEGMIIGSVDGKLITDDTPLDPDQWEDGQPWHWKKEQ